MHLQNPIYTIGHSTLSLEAFLDLLSGHGVQCVADIRRFPGSRKYPHFNREVLSTSLRDAGIDYVWLEQLGGRLDKTSSETLGQLQTQSLCRRYSLGYYFAAAVAQIAWGFCRDDQ